MKKKKAITLLSILSVVMAFLIVMTFIRFPIGVNNYNSVIGAIELDYDVAGGTAYTLTLDKENEKDIDDVDEVIKTLKLRLDSLGYKTYSVKALKDTAENSAYDKVRIEARGKTNEYGEIDTATLSQDIAVVSAYGELEFYGGTSENPTERVFEGEKIIAGANYGGYVNSTYTVNIKFTDNGYDKIVEKIKAGDLYLKISLGETVLLNGSSKLSEDYFVNKTLTLYLSADNGATESDARRTALQISSGGLAYKFNVGDGVSVSSPYGENVAKISLYILLALVVVAIIVLIVLYKGFGVVLSLSLILFIELELLMLLAVPGIVLSMGGIIGIGFSVVLAFDGAVITAKRIKDKLSEKMVKSAVKAGFKEALFPILNIGVVVLVVSGLGFIFLGGTFKCFASIMAIGSVLFTVSNLLFNRMFASLLLPIAKYSEKFFGVNKNGEVKEGE